MLLKPVLVVLEAFKAIKEKHLEAKRIVEEATAQAEKLMNEAEQKALNVYEEAYRKTLSQVEQKAIDLKRNAAKDAEQEIAKFLFTAEDKANGVEAKAKKNFKTAVDSVLNMVLP